jgi:hypothetical protein
MVGGAWHRADVEDAESVEGSKVDTANPRPRTPMPAAAAADTLSQEVCGVAVLAVEPEMGAVWDRVVARLRAFLVASVLKMYRCKCCERLMLLLPNCWWTIL